MPIVAHSALPTFSRLRAEGNEILELERAQKQDIRELHIGLLNMMPDAALQATERQFIRLVGASNRIAQLYIHPFTVDAHVRSADAQSYIESYYDDFATLANEGLDALIITGANPIQRDMSDEVFWGPLTEVLSWARESVCSVICSCLATHADFKITYDLERIRLPEKCWGVYSHKVCERDHPLVDNINTNFNAPHSRLYEISAQQFRDSGTVVLAESEKAGVHLAVSSDGLRFVYFQGHPEYDATSLMKEYRREVDRAISGTRSYPPFPSSYFAVETRDLLDTYQEDAMTAAAAGSSVPVFPQEEVENLLENTWADTGKAIFNNWLGLVYQLTHADRRRLFMEGVDPHNPLGTS